MNNRFSRWLVRVILGIPKDAYDHQRTTEMLAEMYDRANAGKPVFPINHLKKAAEELLLEVSSRFIASSNGEFVNFSEFFNDCFPIFEAARRISRETKGLNFRERKLVCQSVLPLWDAIDNWHFAYNSWLAQFRATDEYRRLAKKPTKNLYASIQTFCPVSEEIDKAIRVAVSSTVKNLEEMRGNED
jgi:hypothetical protein